MFLGAVKAAADTRTDFSRQPHVQGLHDINNPANANIESLPRRANAFTTFLPDTLAKIGDGSIEQSDLDEIAQSAWADIVRAAQKHNKPGEFTTFVAYE